MAGVGEMYGAGHMGVGLALPLQFVRRAVEGSAVQRQSRILLPSKRANLS